MRKAWAGPRAYLVGSALQGKRAQVAQEVKCLPVALVMVLEPRV